MSVLLDVYVADTSFVPPDVYVAFVVGVDDAPYLIVDGVNVSEMLSSLFTISTDELVAVEPSVNVDLKETLSVAGVVPIEE